MSLITKDSLNSNSNENKINSFNFVLTLEQKKELDEKYRLLALYHTYINNYLEFYIKNLEQENQILKARFPNVIFTFLSRIKSEHSYREKLERKGEALDIFADKLIILSVDEKTNEDLLIATSYDMENFLNTYSQDIEVIPRKRKDYIAKPKTNGYSSLHDTKKIIIKDKKSNFFRETQIKTFRMRETEETGLASHFTVYKSDRLSFLSRITDQKTAEYFLPKYMHFEYDRTRQQDKLILDSFESRFRYYFGINYSDFVKDKTIYQK